MNPPIKPFVRTVLGDIAPEQLGVCYAHEHLIIDENYTTQMTPDFLINDVDRCTAELIEVKHAGGSAMVDSMPMACGRNVAKLVEVSRRSGVHVLCPTGLHLAQYYPADHWSNRIDVDEMAELFVREITQGIVDDDVFRAGAGGTPTARIPEPESGPSEYLRTGRGEGSSEVRAGLIKIASSLDEITAYESKIFRAAAMAHWKTGAPILTHTEQGTGAMLQIEMLAAHGVDLSHVVLSHTDRKPDLEYHRKILRTGVRVEYDSAFRWKSGQGNPTRDLILTLLPEFPDQIMIGMDAARRGYWKQYGGAPGLTFLLDRLVPELIRAGLSDHLVHRMMVTTPASAFAFKEIC